MAKTEAPPPPSTYVTGFCGSGNHERCPAIIKNNISGRTWECHCRCHPEGNTGWEPPPEVFDWQVNIVHAVNGTGPYENGHHEWSPTLMQLKEMLERVL